MFDFPREGRCYLSQNDISTLLRASRLNINDADGTGYLLMITS